MDISRKIKDLRIRKELTLEDIGNYVGVSKATVLKWESGTIKNMRRDKIVKLAEVLGTSPADLLGYDDTPKSIEIPADYVKVTPHEKALLDAYRSNLAMQPAVNRLLNIPDE